METELIVVIGEPELKEVNKGVFCLDRERLILVTAYVAGIIEKEGRPEFFCLIRNIELTNLLNRKYQIQGLTLTKMVLHSSFYSLRS